MRYYPLFLLSAIITIGCGSEETLTRKASFNGVNVVLTVEKAGLNNQQIGLLNDAMDLIEKRLDQMVNETGELSRLNRERIINNPSTEFVELTTLAERILKETNGYYDPRLGELKKQWNLSVKNPQPPSIDMINVSLSHARSTRVKIGQNAIALEGEGMIDFGMLIYGWAIDGAYNFLNGNGIMSGSISVGSVYRFWGVKSDGSKRLLRIPEVNSDSVFYVLTPDPGGISVIHSAWNGFDLNGKTYVRLLSPINGQPCDSLQIAVAWAQTASEASALSEAFFVMGRRMALEWTGRNQGYGLMVVYGQEDTYAAETDFLLSSWLSVELP